ncbi:MAG: sigma-54-dependent Fis family transcriptional regulator, partial [Deltaproteobacteria bacterium]|nr:sigma-54-dependent Fis family transcriptional regulator [Deltaproteobacteria bacterium]
FELVEKVAPSKASVVVTGQSGTGKEMIARAIHQLSPRREKPFVAINSSAIPPTLMESEIFGYEKGAFTGADQRRMGCFELADKGTLFLDEVGELPQELQAKFLRVLEDEKVRRIAGKAEIEVDVRVICATHRDLRAEVRAGRFREDLFFRLNVFQIHLCPLRERAEDVPLLAQHFVERFNRESGKRLRGVTPEGMRVLQGYAWPGNVRELRNAVERAVILADGELIGLEHLPPEITGHVPETETLRLTLGLPLAEAEKAYILSSLARNGGNKARTAQILEISEKTLYNRLREYRTRAAAEAASSELPRG